MIPAPTRRSRHEELVAAFLQTCDPAKVAEVESKYRVNDRDCLSDLERTWSPEYMDSHPTTEGHPHRIVPGEAARIRKARRAGEPMHDHITDRCQVCGSLERRCGCCG